MMVFMMAVSLCSVTASGAEEKKGETIRVGYPIYEGYQEGEEGEIKTGSAYEYYQRIRYYTGWKYEYVYGSISDMFELLEKGEIDIMALISYTEERGEKYLFSAEPHGEEAYYLYARDDDGSISSWDTSTLNGKTVGVTLGTYQEEYLPQWCEEQGLTCNSISYRYRDELHAALNNGEVDVIVDHRIIEQGEAEYSWKTIHRFNSDPLYFAVNKSRPDILEEVNRAQEQILANDEFYSYNVTQKYYGGTNYHNAYLTQAEQDFVKSCGILKVGYLDGTNPIAYTDSEGEMKGLAAEYLDVIARNYGMQFEAVEYKNEQLMIEDLKDSVIDIILPLGCGYWTAEELEVALSSVITTLPMSAIYKSMNEYGVFERIAVVKGSVTQEGFVALNYPEAELYYVKNTKEALEAIEKGLADCYFVRSSSMDLMNQKFEIDENFHTVALRHTMEAFMATRVEDTMLSFILDKGISLITDNQRDTAKIKYAYEEEKISLWKAIEDNIILVVGSIVVMLSVLSVIAVIYRLNIEAAHTKKLQGEKDKAEEAWAEAERAQHAKTDFLAQMSHDIRTPMNAIIGFTNFAKETDDVSVIREEYIPKIEMASNQLLMLINDVLEMSRIESGKLIFRRTVNDITKMIDSVVTVMRLQAEEKNLTLTADVEVTDCMVYCDQNHFSRVLMNLLSNAIKFTPSGGSISVTVRQKPCDTEGKVAYEVKVTDTGIGMTPEFMKKIFEPFERERTSTVSRTQGTGLGMAIVKRIVDTAGDKIEVESVVGEGTTFTHSVQFYLADSGQITEKNGAERARKAPSPQELKEYFSGKRILLAEDNEFNSTIAETLLENAGFHVETADNGHAAVQKVINAPTQNYYDVILMDIQMPVMNGYEASKAIRALADDRAKVKIIAVTANAFDSDKQEAKDAGMDGHIAKPIDVNVLYNTLLEITEL